MNFLQNVEDTAVTLIPNVRAVKIIESESYCERHLSPYQNYRVVDGAGAAHVRAYISTEDVNTTTPSKVVPRSGQALSESKPGFHILELIRRNQPGSVELAEIILPTRRTTAAYPPSPAAAKDEDRSLFPPRLGLSSTSWNSGLRAQSLTSEQKGTLNEKTNKMMKPGPVQKRLALSENNSIRKLKPSLVGEHRCLHDELQLADCLPTDDSWTCSGRAAVHGLVQRAAAVDSGRLARLARAIETDECVGNGEAAAALAAARCLAVRLRLLLDESRDLRYSVAEIHDDVQDASRRATTASCTARELAHEAHALALLDDVLVLLRADPARTSAVAARRGWPFAPAPAFARTHANYVV